MEGQDNNNQTNNQNVEVNNTTVNNQNNDVLKPSEDAVKPNSVEVNTTKDTPKTHVDAVSTNDEVEKSSDLPSAKDADVGTKTSIEQKTTIKDRMLDGLPGIGVPNKDKNSNFNINNNDNKADTGEKVTSEVKQEPLTFKKKIQYFFTIIFFILLCFKTLINI